MADLLGHAALRQHPDHRAPPGRCVRPRALPARSTRTTVPRAASSSATRHGIRHPAHDPFKITTRPYRHTGAPIASRLRRPLVDRCVCFRATSRRTSRPSPTADPHRDHAPITRQRQPSAVTSATTRPHRCQCCYVDAALPASRPLPITRPCDPHRSRPPLASDLPRQRPALHRGSELPNAFGPSDRQPPNRHRRHLHHSTQLPDTPPTRMTASRAQNCESPPCSKRAKLTQRRGDSRSAR